MAMTSLIPPAAAREQFEQLELGRSEAHFRATDLHKVARPVDFQFAETQPDPTGRRTVATPTTDRVIQLSNVRTIR